MQENCSSYEDDTSKLEQQLREVQLSLSAFRHQMGLHHSPASACSTASQWTVGSMASQLMTATSVWSPSTEYSFNSPTSTSNVATMLSVSCQLSDSDYTFSSRGDETRQEVNCDITTTDDSDSDAVNQSADCLLNCTSATVSKLMFGESPLFEFSDMDTNSSMTSAKSHSMNLSDNSSIPESISTLETSTWDSTVDSDASAFIELPLSHRPVTHRTDKQQSMGKQLKRVGK